MVETRSVVGHWVYSELVVERRAHFCAGQRRCLSSRQPCRAQGGCPGWQSGAAGSCLCPRFGQGAHLFLGCQCRAGSRANPTRSSDAPGAASCQTSQTWPRPGGWGQSRAVPWDRCRGWGEPLPSPWHGPNFVEGGDDMLKEQGAPTAAH